VATSKPVFFAFTLLLLFLCQCCFAQIKQDQLIVGEWKGTSICQVKNSPCHDEVVVCHISKAASDSFHFMMNKIVNGKEEEMGMLTCILNRPSGQIRSIASKGSWTFSVKDGIMDGRLVYDGNLYRILHMEKVK
jgi:hypothetical protein